MGSCGEGDGQDDDAVLDELTDLVLTELGPVVQAYRREVERRSDPDRQDLEVALRAHPARDAVLDGLRRRLRHQIVDAVPRRDHADRRIIVPRGMATITSLLHRHTREMGDEAAFARRVQRYRRERAGETPWWER